MKSAWTVLFAVTVGATGNAAEFPVEMHDDAELADVAFIDTDRGWAVGDRGTIWHTLDGGRNWRRQESGVSCRLESVWFIDHQTGWAVGGSSRPYTHTSQGVVLQTQNGGRTWRQIAANRLPWLTQVQFHDAQHGYALGIPSAMYPSGLFRSNDAGRTWTPVSNSRSKRWLADFRGGGEALLVASDGAVALWQRDRVVSGAPIRLGLRSLRQVASSGQLTWTAGDGGVLYVSNNGGKNWNPATRLRALAGDNFDFKTLSVVGDKCWVAGSPGSCVFHSRDGGRNWLALKTNQTIPIQSLTFVDEHRGWAVGSLGTILATRDGGRSWHVQRSGGSRLAMLGIFNRPRDVPLELVTKLSGNDGFLSAVEILTRNDMEVPPREHVPLPMRTHEAVIASGACGAETSWRFPIRQSGLQLPAAAIVEGWDASNDGRGTQTIERYIVKRIRQWRPDVIVTEAASPRGDEPLSHLTNQVTLSAVEKAADRAAFPDQLKLGLQPWTVKKVIARTSNSAANTYTLGSAQLALRLGCSLSDRAKFAESLIADEFRPSAASMGFQLLKTQVDADLARQDFFSGIDSKSGTAARRRIAPLPDQTHAVRLAARRQRNITSMVAMSERVGPASSAWLGQLNDLTRGLSAEQAGQMLYQMAWQYRHRNRPDLAAEVAATLVRKFPGNRYWDAAATWLMQYYASGEAKFRMQRAGVAEAQARGAPRRRNIQPARFEEPRLGPLHPSGQPPNGQALTTTMQRQALALGRFVEKNRLDLLAEPQFRFPLVSIQRAEGIPQSANAHLQSAALHPFRSWSECARAEFWLKRQNGAPPKEVSRCIAVTTRPRLDGKLDEAVWRTAQPIALRSGLHDDAEWPAVALVAHDADYLYLAVRCRKAPGAAYTKTDKPRKTDEDLSEHDRVDLLIDIDRDYATYYRLTVDHRGWPNDACCGDKSWNPKWYIATDSDEESWSVEAAIEMKYLAPRRQGRKKIWAAGIQRTVPAVGFQSWTRLAGVKPRPEGFGLLMFE